MISLSSELVATVVQKPLLPTYDEKIWEIFQYKLPNGHVRTVAVKITVK